jgi:hypothetical protein
MSRRAKRKLPHRDRRAQDRLRRNQVFHLRGGVCEPSGDASDARLIEMGRFSSPLSRWTVSVVCALLLLSVALVFCQTVQSDFIQYDDEDYVCGNPPVAHGFTTQGIVWAFTHFHSNNWHPLTWLSHMLDCQLYGLKHPGGHHLTNVLLHAISAILLFLVLREMTGDLWPSAFVASLFAIHPCTWNRWPGWRSARTC